MQSTCLGRALKSKSLQLPDASQLRHEDGRGPDPCYETTNPVGSIIPNETPSSAMKMQVEEYKRGDVAESLYYEAQCRVEDPVYGCVGIVTLLQQEMKHLLGHYEDYRDSRREERPREKERDSRVNGEKDRRYKSGEGKYDKENYKNEDSKVSKQEGNRITQTANCNLQVEEYKRGDVAESLYYEAQCRVENPVYGCVGIITLLQQEIYNFESQLAKIEAQIRLLKAQGATPTL
nr:LOB domain-containing protein 24-like [Ipomoea trifida]